MQRLAVREKLELKGDPVTDAAFVYCCGCCDLVQKDKELAWLAANSGSGGAGVPVVEQPVAGHQMTYQGV